MSNSNYKAVQNLLDIYDEGDLETKKISNRSSGSVWCGGLEATEILLKIYTRFSPDENMRSSLQSGSLVGWFSF